MDTYNFKQGKNSKKMQWFEPSNQNSIELLSSINRKAMKKRELEQLEDMGCKIIIEWEYDPKF